MSRSITAPTPAAVLAAASPAPGRRRGGPRTGIVAALASVLLHLLIFAFVRFQLVFEPRPPRPVVQSYQLRPAMQAYDIIPIEVAPGAIEPVLPPPRQLIEAAPPAPELAVPPAPAAAGARTPDPSVSERLRRTPTADLELWRPVTPGSYERPLTEEEVLRARLAARIDAHNDSVSADALARERASDWTVKDGSGGKWGVSPGKVHLGGITLPLPVNFSPPPGRREEVAARTRSWTETRAQADRAEADDNFKDRVKAIRERREAQRDSADGGSD
ncbi:MAG TPA: hypothetical protein VK939_03835 [Longimicrobiales bacterium]|nr:hypothetical protein [Longimicrobiales bacterium]